MIKLVFCLRRRPEMTLAEFQAYWREKHAPLVKSHAETLKIRRYVQTHTTDNPALQEAMAASRSAQEAYDGVAELWWDSLEDFIQAGTTAEGRAAGQALLEDESKFIDLERCSLWIGEEHTVVGD